MDGHVCNRLKLRGVLGRGDVDGGISPRFGGAPIDFPFFQPVTIVGPFTPPLFSCKFPLLFGSLEKLSTLHHVSTTQEQRIATPSERQFPAREKEFYNFTLNYKLATVL